VCKNCEDSGRRLVNSVDRLIGAGERRAVS
jgi:hypothetical protein